jgi:hypothetical protein|tara:strand:+ start:3872 stop:4015 length:144 start_codon:yes stop_codon:yes gene_type:complete
MNKEHRKTTRLGDAEMERMKAIQEALGLKGFSATIRHIINDWREEGE